jgi:hypothetical protein
MFAAASHTAGIVDADCTFVQSTCFFLRGFRNSANDAEKEGSHSSRHLTITDGYSTKRLIRAGPNGVKPLEILAVTPAGSQRYKSPIKLLLDFCGGAFSGMEKC